MVRNMSCTVRDFAVKLRVEPRVNNKGNYNNKNDVDNNNGNKDVPFEIRVFVAERK